MKRRVVDTGRGDFFGFVSREPVGVVAAILPWNSPLLLLTFKLAPALAAGCTMVAKPSEQAPVSILLLAELFAEAGFPPGVFNTVSGASRQVGEWLVAHPDVASPISLPGGAEPALLASFAVDWLGAENIRRFTVRFREQVWPGDVLTCSGEITAVSPDEGGFLVTAELSATRQTGGVAVSASADFLVPVLPLA